MTIYAGLDVSDKTTHICVVDDAGAIVRRDVVASDPEVLAKWLAKHCADLTRVVPSGLCRWCASARDMRRRRCLPG